MNFKKFCKHCGLIDEYDNMSDSELVIFNNLLKRFMNLFKFENIDETINERELMLSIIFNDSYMIIECDGVLRNVYGGLSGEMDFYGYPTRYLWTTGYTSGDNLITDGVVGHSNSLWTPLGPTILYYTKILANLDTSLCIASMNTRITPIYGASSDAERKALDECFNDMIKGKTHSYLIRKNLAEILNENGNMAIDLTGKSGDTQYIPMLLQAYDNVLARVCRELGINITNVMKRAQVISAEVNGYENYTQIFLDDMLKNIKATFDAVNERWDRNWSVELSVAFDDDDLIEENLQEKM